MAYDKQKLLQFRETILKNADFEIIEIKNKIANYEKVELENAKNKKLNEIFEFMQNNARAIRLKFKQKLSKESLKLRNEIIIFRSEMVEAFKKACKNALQNFAQTPNYESYLIESIKNSCKNLNLEQATLKLKRADLNLKSKILTVASFNSIEADDSIEVGGFKIILKNQNLLIDKTLINLLQNEMKNFNKNCELNLNIDL